LYTAGSAAADEIAEFEQVGVSNEIKDVVAFAAAADETAVIESLEVLGDVGLIAAEGGGDFADGAFATFEELKDAEAERLAEEAEPAGDSVEQALVGEGAKSGFWHREYAPKNFLTISPYTHTVVKREDWMSRHHDD
jgi:hypothetical protein